MIEFCWYVKKAQGRAVMQTNQIQLSEFQAGLSRAAHLIGSARPPYRTPHIHSFALAQLRLALAHCTSAPAPESLSAKALPLYCTEAAGHHHHHRPSQLPSGDHLLRATPRHPNRMPFHIGQEADSWRHCTGAALARSSKSESPLLK